MIPKSRSQSSLSDYRDQQYPTRNHEVRISKSVISKNITIHSTDHSFDRSRLGAARTVVNKNATRTHVSKYKITKIVPSGYVPTVKQPTDQTGSKQEIRKVTFDQQALDKKSPPIDKSVKVQIDNKLVTTKRYTLSKDSRPRRICGCNNALPIELKSQHPYLCKTLSAGDTLNTKHVYLTDNLQKDSTIELNKQRAIPIVNSEDLTRDLTKEYLDSTEYYSRCIDEVRICQNEDPARNKKECLSDKLSQRPLADNTLTFNGTPDLVINEHKNNRNTNSIVNRFFPYSTGEPQRNNTIHKSIRNTQLYHTSDLETCVDTGITSARTHEACVDTGITSAHTSRGRYNIRTNASSKQSAKSSDSSWETLSTNNSRVSYVELSFPDLVAEGYESYKKRSKHFLHSKPQTSTSRLRVDYSSAHSSTHTDASTYSSTHTDELYEGKPSRSKLYSQTRPIYETLSLINNVKADVKNIKWEIPSITSTSSSFESSDSSNNETGTATEVNSSAADSYYVRSRLSAGVRYKHKLDRHRKRKVLHLKAVKYYKKLDENRPKYIDKKIETKYEKNEKQILEIGAGEVQSAVKEDSPTKTDQDKPKAQATTENVQLGLAEHTTQNKTKRTGVDPNVVSQEDGPKKSISSTQQNICHTDKPNDDKGTSNASRSSSRCTISQWSDSDRPCQRFKIESNQFYKDDYEYSTPCYPSHSHGCKKSNRGVKHEDKIYEFRYKRTDECNEASKEKTPPKGQIKKQLFKECPRRKGSPRTKDSPRSKDSPRRNDSQRSKDSPRNKENNPKEKVVEEKKCQQKSPTVKPKKHHCKTNKAKDVPHEEEVHDVHEDEDDEDEVHEDEIVEDEIVDNEEEIVEVEIEEEIVEEHVGENVETKVIKRKEEKSKQKVTKSPTPSPEKSENTEEKRKQKVTKSPKPSPEKSEKTEEKRKQKGTKSPKPSPEKNENNREEPRNDPKLNIKLDADKETNVETKDSATDNNDNKGTNQNKATDTKKPPPPPPSKNPAPAPSKSPAPAPSKSSAPASPKSPAAAKQPEAPKRQAEISSNSSITNAALNFFESTGMSYFAKLLLDQMQTVKNKNRTLKFYAPPRKGLYVTPKPYPVWIYPNDPLGLYKYILKIRGRRHAVAASGPDKPCIDTCEASTSCGNICSQAPPVVENNPDCSERTCDQLTNPSCFGSSHLKTHSLTPDVTSYRGYHSTRLLWSRSYLNRTGDRYDPYPRYNKYATETICNVCSDSKPRDNDQYPDYKQGNDSRQPTPLPRDTIILTPKPQLTSEKDHSPKADKDGTKTRPATYIIQPSPRLPVSSSCVSQSPPSYSRLAPFYRTENICNMSPTYLSRTPNASMDQYKLLTPRPIVKEGNGTSTGRPRTDTLSKRSQNSTPPKQSQCNALLRRSPSGTTSKRPPSVPPLKWSSPGTPSMRSPSGTFSKRSPYGTPSKRSSNGTPSKRSPSGTPSKRSQSATPSRRSISATPSRHSPSNTPSRRSPSATPSKRSPNGTPSKRSPSVTPSRRSPSPMVSAIRQSSCERCSLCPPKPCCCGYAQRVWPCAEDPLKIVCDHDECGQFREKYLPYSSGLRRVCTCCHESSDARWNIDTNRLLPSGLYARRAVTSNVLLNADSDIDFRHSIQARPMYYDPFEGKMPAVLNRYTKGKSLRGLRGSSHSTIRLKRKKSSRSKRYTSSDVDKAFIPCTPKGKPSPVKLKRPEPIRPALVNSNTERQKSDKSVAFSDQNSVSSYQSYSSKHRKQRKVRRKSKTERKSRPSTTSGKEPWIRLFRKPPVSRSHSSVSSNMSKWAFCQSRFASGRKHIRLFTDESSGNSSRRMRKPPSLIPHDTAAPTKRPASPQQRQPAAPPQQRQSAAPPQKTPTPDTKKQTIPTPKPTVKLPEKQHTPQHGMALSADCLADEISHEPHFMLSDNGTQFPEPSICDRKYACRQFIGHSRLHLVGSTTDQTRQDPIERRKSEHISEQRFLGCCQKPNEPGQTRDGQTRDGETRDGETRDGDARDEVTNEVHGKTNDHPTYTVLVQKQTCSIKSKSQLIREEATRKQNAYIMQDKLRRKVEAHCNPLREDRNGMSVHEAEVLHMCMYCGGDIPGKNAPKLEPEVELEPEPEIRIMSHMSDPSVLKEYGTSCDLHLLSSDSVDDSEVGSKPRKPHAQVFLQPTLSAVMVDQKASHSSVTQDKGTYKRSRMTASTNRLNKKLHKSLTSQMTVTHPSRSTSNLHIAEEEGETQTPRADHRRKKKSPSGTSAVPQPKEDRLHKTRASMVDPSTLAEAVHNKCKRRRSRKTKSTSVDPKLMIDRGKRSNSPKLLREYTPRVSLDSKVAICHGKKNVLFSPYTSPKKKSCVQSPKEQAVLQVDKSPSLRNQMNLSSGERSASHSRLQKPPGSPGVDKTSPNTKARNTPSPRIIKSPSNLTPYTRSPLRVKSRENTSTRTIKSAESSSGVDKKHKNIRHARCETKRVKSAESSSQVDKEHENYQTAHAAIKSTYDSSWRSRGPIDRVLPSQRREFGMYDKAFPSHGYDNQGSTLSSSQPQCLSSRDPGILGSNKYTSTPSLRFPDYTHTTSNYSLGVYSSLRYRSGTQRREWRRYP